MTLTYRKPYYKYEEARKTVYAAYRMVKGKQKMLGKENYERLRMALDIMRAKITTKKHETDLTKSFSETDEDSPYFGLYELFMCMDDYFERTQPERREMFVERLYNLLFMKIMEVERQILATQLSELEKHIRLKASLSKY